MGDEGDANPDKDDDDDDDVNVNGVGDGDPNGEAGAAGDETPDDAISLAGTPPTLRHCHCRRSSEPG